MKKISLLITALCLTSFLNAQTKEYKLTTERTTEISKKYSSLPTVYKISKKEVGTPTKSALILDEEVEDIKTISGIFIAIDKEYVVLRRDFEGYNSNELIEVEIFKNKNIPYDNKRDLGDKVVIFNKENDQYYLADRFLLGEFALDMTLVNFENKLNKLGYKTESKNDDIIIFVNTTKIILTNDIYQNVNNGNVNYINEIANSVNQFQSYVNQAFLLTEKLVNHFNAHRNRTMNSTRMTQWKSDLKNAKIIYNKINSLKGNNIENATNFNKQISIKTLDKYNEFWQVLRGSEEVLGM